MTTTRNCPECNVPVNDELLCESCNHALIDIPITDEQVEKLVADGLMTEYEDGTLNLTEKGAAILARELGLNPDEPSL
jgi:hypothetical protein